MPRLFVANLNFEQEIAGDRQILPVALRQRTAEHACAWLAVANPGDFIWCPQPPAPDFWERMSDRGIASVTGISSPADAPPGLELTPWGWTQTVRRRARSLRARIAAPPQAAVRAANSRRWSSQLETRWNVGLEGAAEIRSEADLTDVLRSVTDTGRWVLKSEFGAAARQRIVCTGPTPDGTAAGWIRRRLSAGEWLTYEPWVQRIAEAGLQWSIPEQGVPRLEGVTELFSDSAGQFIGSRFGLSREEFEAWQPAIDVGEQAVAEIQRLGYFGPVGIDAMRYRMADGSERMRPLQDINARWTMGRLALGWQRIIPAGVWRHGTPREFEERLRSHPGILRTSPETIGDQPADTATWLEPALSARRDAEREP